MLDIDLLAQINPGQAVIMNDGRLMTCDSNFPSSLKICLSDPKLIGGGTEYNYSDIKEIIAESRVNTRWSDGTPFCR